LDPVALVDDNPAETGSTVFEMSYQRKKSAPVLQGPLTRELITANDAAHVIIAIPSLPNYRFQEAVQEVTLAKATMAFVPTQSVRSDLLVHYEDLDGQLVASFWENARTAYEVLKSIWDVIATIAILALTLPLFIVLAVLIKLDSPGPVFFLQTRIGLDGKPFRLWKFRTMLQETEPYDFSPKAATDPRITNIGKFLRRTSLDELPQLFNVLMGDMALVGPRPEMPFIVEQYSSVHRQRLRVKPGLTGLWQLSADRAYLIHENIQYDLYYIRNRNFFLDIAILLHTVVFAMRGV
jgi:exopolysaccharide biosynthesis polyprenyl glycosylphosphotransferase